MKEVHLGAVKPDTKMIRVKIELRDSDISRTVVVPGDLSLDDFSDVIQCAIGWDGSHPWEFFQGKEVDWNCDMYEDEPKPKKSQWYHERWHQAPCEHTIEEVLDKKGKRLYYTYDFGDCWEHVVYRMADPKEDVMPCCEKTSGTWGVDDIGGTWGLDSVIKALRKWEKDCTDDECKEGELSGDKRFWYGWGKKAVRDKFLAGPSAAEVTARLSELFTDSDETTPAEYITELARGEESAVKPPVKPAKVGRNDPCPCGSGKKFKKCCGR